MRLCVVLMIWLAGAVGAGERLVGPLDGSVLDDLPAVDVMILGEIHDNPAHHANQAAALRHLQPRVIVFEMLTEDQAAIVTPGLRRDEAALAAALNWQASGWPDFAFYYPLFVAAPQAHIYGAMVARDDIGTAIQGDAAAAFGPDAARFGLVEPLPEDQQARREKVQMEAHCNALPPEVLPGMVMVQRLRDAALARAVSRAFDATGGPVAVITGNGHARIDWGVPAVLRRAAPELTVLALGQFEDAPSASPPFDFWLVNDPVERDDPCKAFQ